MGVRVAKAPAFVQIKGFSKASKSGDIISLSFGRTRRIFFDYRIGSTSYQTTLLNEKILESIDLMRVKSKQGGSNANSP